ncbi:MAG: type II secretion system protein [Phycisphaerales bacterium]|jgi:prepilin-type N-terminal cleavage/methylation domain-containing protein|nr:type II secretion system protein [Phycisphaerales bacterium]
MSITLNDATKRTARPAGFTLIELLAVMLIIGILMTLVVGVVKKVTENAAIKETQTHMTVMMTAIKEYQQVQQANGYPQLTSGNWVSRLAAETESREIINSLPNNVWSPDRPTEFRDSWNNKIAYSPTGGLGGTPGLTSGGPDGDTSTTDDNVRYNDE